MGEVGVELTRREFELIELLADAHGQVMQREEIYQRVWGYAMVHGDRSVDVFVRKLRQKLERALPRWRYIHTHFGIGYRFAAEPVEAEAPAASRRAVAARLPTRSPRPSASASGSAPGTARPARPAPSRGELSFLAWARIATGCCATSRS